MNTRKLGSSNVFVSEQVFGCWAIGGTYFTGAQDQQSIAAIRQAIDCVITTLDTAPVYGNGHSEQLVAQATKGYDRDKLTIISKLTRSCLAREKVRPTFEQSLKDLETDYLDVYFIHWPSNTGDPIDATMDELMKLKNEGKIRCIGVSNFSKEQLMEARQYGEIDVIQPCYNLLWRYLDFDCLDYCKENNIGIINYSTLAQGLLTGKFTADTTFPDNDGRSHAAIFQHPYFEGALVVVEKLRPFAEKYGVTLSQLSIRFIMQTPGITAPIVGAKNPAQVMDNVKASNFEISKEDYDAIDQISKDYAYKLPQFQSFFHA